MPANAALKEQAYIADATDPVTTAGIAIIRTHKAGILAEAFGHLAIARRKVAETLKALGHQYNIDAMCLEALERYVEEHGEVPNATKVIASAQILDRLPDPQFDSGHRVVFAINEDGTEFVGASEMGLAISPGGTTTTSRTGKMDERFGAITKQTLWIMIDFPEKSELDAIEMEQQLALAAVAEALADPASAAENLDQIVAQIQELGAIADIDIAATIETVANVIEAHALATEAQTLIETGIAAPDSPKIEAMTARIEALSHHVAEQLAAPDAPVPPAIVETVQAVMETIEIPPAAMPQAPAADSAISANASPPPQQQQQAQPITDSVAPTTQTPGTDQPASIAPQSMENSAIELPPAQTHETAQPADINQAAMESPAAPESSQPQTTSVDTPAAAIPAAANTPAPIDTPAAVIPAEVKAEASIITPQAFEQAPPPAALAAQITALAVQLPPSHNTALTQTVMKQVATAVKNEQHVPAALQKRVEAVIASMPSGPAKQELGRVVEIVKAQQDTRKAAFPVASPILQPAPAIKHIFAAPASPPHYAPPPRNDNKIVTAINQKDTPPVPTRQGSDPAPIIVTQAHAAPDTAPPNPQPAKTGGHDRAQPAPPPIAPEAKDRAQLAAAPAADGERIRPTENNHSGGTGPQQPETGGGGNEPPQETPKIFAGEKTEIRASTNSPEDKTQVIEFSKPCGRKGPCASGCSCPFADVAGDDKTIKANIANSLNHSPAADQFMQKLTAPAHKAA